MEESARGGQAGESEGSAEPLDLGAAHAAASETFVVGAALAEGVVVPQGRRVGGVPTGRPVYTDMEDGVIRCGVCGWELIGCMCRGGEPA
jgi:hypothetical protein